MASEGSLMTSVMYKIKWKWSREGMIIIAKKGQASSKKIYNPKSREVQMQPSITKNPSAELKIQISTKKYTKTDRITKKYKFVLFSGLLTLPFSLHICELTEGGDWKYAVGELLPTIWLPKVAIFSFNSSYIILAIALIQCY